jgi:hypothetical protein
MTERMTTPDLARVLADQAESLARALFPAGRQQGHHWCVGSLAGEPGQSLRISLAGKHRGRWRDFADGSGGDLLDLVRRRPVRRRSSPGNWLGAGSRRMPRATRNQS